jgi:hypothetical protein
MILCRVDNEVSINSARNCKEELSFVCSLQDMCHNESCEDCPSNKKCQFSGTKFVRYNLTSKLQNVWIINIQLNLQDSLNLCDPVCEYYSYCGLEVKNVQTVRLKIFTLKKYHFFSLCTCGDSVNIF